MTNGNHVPASEPKAVGVDVRETTAVLGHPDLNKLLPEVSVSITGLENGATLEQKRASWLDLVNSPSCNDGQYQIWLLVRRDDADAQSDPLAYAGTLRRTCLVRRPDGTTTEEVYYQWMPIMTPVKHQGNGYAKHLVRLIHYFLADPAALAPFPTDAWGPPPSLFGSVDRPPALPRAIGTLLASAVPPNVYTRMSMTLASGEERTFEFHEDQLNDQIRLELAEPSEAAEIRASNNDKTGEWTATWVTWGELPSYEPFVARDAREAVSKIDGVDAGRTVCHPLPSTGQLQFLDFRVRHILGLDRGCISPETIAGVRLVPSAAVGSDGLLPPHKDGWPLCVCPTLIPKASTMLHASGINSTSAASFIVEKLSKMGADQGSRVIIAKGRLPGDNLIKALLAKGGNIRQIRDFRYGSPPLAFFFLGEGEVAVRGHELYASP